MPFTTIALRKGKSPEYRRAVADAVHEALVETLRIPEDDRFQLIDEYGPDNLIYAPSFLGIERSDDIVIVRITLVSGRPRELRAALHRSIADKLAASPGLRREDVFVSLVENDIADWSAGRGEAPLLKKLEIIAEAS
ncbi:MAG TPA: tautomerase family protein [Sphingomicrobium sp.]|nr:tautomerase family protein [Sphingomicrobium sp.]